VSDNLDEIDPKHIAAAFDRPDDVDMLQGDSAQDLARRAVRVGGIIHTEAFPRGHDASER
jgi:hypothetical protein